MGIGKIGLRRIGLRYATTGLGVVAPNGAPSALILTVVDDTTIKLDWTNGSTNHDGHRIYISTDGVTFSANSTVLGATATKQVTGLAYTDPSFQFYVKAYKGTNESTASNTVQAERGNIGAYPMPASETLSTPTIYVDSAATGAGTGADWANAFTTIGAAITSASDGDIIEVSGGASGKTYAANLDITKPVTIQGSKTTGHSATAIIDGQIGSHNTSGRIKVINFKKIVTSDAVYPILTYANSAIEFYDIFFGPQFSTDKYPRLDGGTAKFIRCTFNRTLRINTSASFVMTYQSASSAEFEYCLFDHAGIIYTLPAGSTAKFNHCTILASGLPYVDSFIDIGNSATTTIEVTDTAFFGVHPMKSGASSKSPVVTNVFWHKTPYTMGSTTFDSSNKSTIVNAITSINPLFVTPKNTIMGDICVRIDDRNNLPTTETACATLNPEIKVTQNVDIHGYDATTRPTSTQIDIMRRLIAAGNEIGCHGSTHCSLDSLNCISISATGTTPLLNIVVVQAGDSSTWTGTLSITINSVTEDFDLSTYNTLTSLITAINGNTIGDGVVTATKIGATMSDYLYTRCLDAVTNQSISTTYTILLNDTAFNRFEVSEAILDLEAYINGATDRNGNNAVAGTTEPVPNPVYVCKTYFTAYSTGRASVLTLLQNNPNIVGANAALGSALNNGLLYSYGAALNMYTFNCSQGPDDISLFAMACYANANPSMVICLYHGFPLYAGTVAGFKSLLQDFGCGSQTFTEFMNYIRTDGGWTITEPNAVFSGTYEDYMSLGDYNLQEGSPLKGVGKLSII
jgi:hypothetical protein